jgi:ferritin
MISKKMTDCINQQINRELYSAYLYLAMAAGAKAVNLNGFANWFTVQFHEETTHAMKMFGYLAEQGSRVELKAIEQPPKDFSSSLEMFEETLAHEKKVTKMIHGLADLAQKESDHATYAFLQWFVTEQIEEEANAVDIIEKLKLINKSGAALIMLDHQLGERKFNP